MIYSKPTKNGTVDPLLKSSNFPNDNERTSESRMKEPIQIGFLKGAKLPIQNDQYIPV